MSEAGWEHWEHDADIGIRACAATREQLYEQFAEALTAVVTDPASVRAEQDIAISCEAPDDALLLVDWLNALIFEMATRNMVFGRWRVALEGRRLTAVAWGERVDRRRHEPAVEVKGATYTALTVTKDSDGVWRGQCVVDV